MGPFEFQSRTRVVFGEGAIDRLGALATELGFHRTLLVADRGLVDAGHAERATGLLTLAHCCSGEKRVRKRQPALASTSPRAEPSLRHRNLSGANDRRDSFRPRQPSLTTLVSRSGAFWFSALQQ